MTEFLYVALFLEDLKLEASVTSENSHNNNNY